MVMIQAGKVVGGVIVVDNPEDFEEGATVTVIAEGANEVFDLSAEDEQELLDRAAECERGEGVDGEALMNDLRARVCRRSAP
jgi:hypothetical protein